MDHTQEEKLTDAEKLKEYRKTLISSMELNVIFSRNEYRVWVASGMIWFAMAAIPPYTLFPSLVYLGGSIISFVYAKSSHTYYAKFQHHLNVLRAVADLHS